VSSQEDSMPKIIISSIFAKKYAGISKK